MSLIEDSSEPVMTRYRRALGGFIHDFALLEASIFDLLCAAAGLSNEMGSALFSGTRADQMISLAKRCYEVREIEPPAFLAAAFQQIGVLNGVRNDAVHLATFAIEDDDADVLATNMLRNIPSRRKDMLLSPSDLDAMSSDARILPAYLLIAAAEIREPGSTQTLSEEMRGPQRPWRYKPSGQDNPRRRE